MVDPLGSRRVHGEKDVRADLRRLDIEQELRLGNIHTAKAKLMAQGITTEDIERFLREQWIFGQQNIYKWENAYADFASATHPDITGFAVHDPNAAMGEGEGKDLFKGMVAAVGKGMFKGAGEKEPQSLEEIQNMAEGTLDEWESFSNEMWGYIFDAQFAADYRKKMDDVMAEVQRIISMAKAGQVDPEYVLLALAKVNATKNGCLMTWYGKKAFMTNQEMNQVADDLRLAGTGDLGAVYDAQARTRDGQFQLNLLVQDMQKVAQNVEQTFTFVGDFIGDINRMRREIIARFGAQG